MWPEIVEMTKTKTWHNVGTYQWNLYFHHPLGEKLYLRTIMNHTMPILLVKPIRVFSDGQHHRILLYHHHYLEELVIRAVSGNPIQKVQHYLAPQSPHSSQTTSAASATIQKVRHYLAPWSGSRHTLPTEPVQPLQPVQPFRKCNTI